MLNKLVPLRDCPIGLFMCEDTLCVKTRYDNKSYIVWNGEYFLDGVKSHKKIGDILVLPIPDNVVSNLEQDFARNMKFAIKDNENSE